LLVKVSNPYRYSTNLDTSGSMQWLEEFQTLIGILQTEPTQDERFYASGLLFQTLIGILQTLFSFFTYFHYNKFQTLIGILQTCLCTLKKQAPWMVSNPYRYSTNGNRNAVYFGESVSNPYRYSTNVLRRLTQKIKIIVSNPYRYSTNHLIQSGIRWLHLRFKPL